MKAILLLWAVSVYKVDGGLTQECIYKTQDDAYHLSMFISPAERCEKRLVLGE
ncbi:hypothetical protein [Vibrio fortis]|uniref:hypothetical protein n=1 Tax=Vibrio fortis TaxID=212667 RepID=UPI001782BE6B|nr:hypothetical protein [Vibrio fortis]